MRWIWRILGTLGALILLAVLAGLLLPKAHVAARVATVHRPPEEVWKALVQVEGATAWRPDLAKVERLADRYGNLTWRETDRRGWAVTFEATESIAPRRQVRQIIDRDLPFGGNWVIEIQPVPEGSRVRITEHGEIFNPLFRVMARCFSGYTRAIDEFLRSLGRKFGDAVEPRPA
jgi:hypothetical protein